MARARPFCRAAHPNQRLDGPRLTRREHADDVTLLFLHGLHAAQWPHAEATRPLLQMISTLCMYELDRNDLNATSSTLCRKAGAVNRRAVPVLGATRACVHAPGGQSCIVDATTKALASPLVLRTPFSLHVAFKHSFLKSRVLSF